MLWAARVVCWGFELGEDVGFEILWAHFNPRCQPEWSESEIRRKCSQAMDPHGFKYPRGWLLDQELPDRPRPVASSSTPSPGQPTRPPARLDPSELSGPRPADAPPPEQVRPDGGRDWEAGQGGGLVPPRRPGGELEIPSPDGPPVTIRNFTATALVNGGVMKLGTPPQPITRDVLAATRGWPKAAGGRLFVPGPDGAPAWLDDATTLFSWLSTEIGRNGGVVEWGRKEGHITKPEYHLHLSGAVEQYDDVQVYPHWPRRPNTYYMHPDLPAGGSGAFERLLNEMQPATDVDRHLLRAFFLTLAWGGSPGARPIFLFEAQSTVGKPGQGAGKSTAAMIAGKLFGGYVNISLATADDMQVQNRLLSPTGRKSRLVIFDNLKGTRTSNSLIESYVTADKISGKEMYVGEGERLNLIAWAVTANQPSLSRDLTQRSYVIRVIPPVYSPEWGKRINQLIEEFRWQIMGDIVAELQAPPVAVLEDGEWSRWSEWELDVLCRVCDPRDILPEIANRRAQLDDDDATVFAVREGITSFLKRHRPAYDPEALYLKLKAETLTEALGKMCPQGSNQIVVCRWLGSMTIPGLTRCRTDKSRYWLWRGNKPISDQPIDWDDIPL